ncbi:MAG: MarR family winged helix-turn-helix transcriptional regulator [Pseudonocardiaceae bacterium]
MSKGMPARRDAEETADSLDSVTDAVLTASRLLVAVAARSLAGLEEEVTLAQYRTLVVLASRGPQKPADVAVALGVTASTVTRMSDRLVRKGLIRRRASRRDRREVRLGLTDAGRLLIEEATRVRRRELAGILAAVPAEEQRALIRALGYLNAAGGEVSDQDWALAWA